MRGRLAPRLTGFAGCAAAVLAGIAFMMLGHAPPAYAMVNGATLVLALALIAAIPEQAGQHRAGLVGIAALAVLTASLFGPGSEGVHRWIAAGPIRLNAAMLALPVLCVATALTEARFAALLTAAAAVIIALQPDRAAALALLCGTAPQLRGAANGPGLIGCLAAAAALALCWIRPDGLAPVPFVEDVLQAAWTARPALCIAMVASLLTAAVLPSRITLSRTAALALGGTLAGFTLASLVGAFPTPLAGYGASAILGYAAAIALLPLNGRADVS